MKYFLTFQMLTSKKTKKCFLLLTYYKKFQELIRLIIKWIQWILKKYFNKQVFKISQIDIQKILIYKTQREIKYKLKTFLWILAKIISINLLIIQIFCLKARLIKLLVKGRYLMIRRKNGNQFPLDLIKWILKAKLMQMK